VQTGLSAFASQLSSAPLPYCLHNAVKNHPTDFTMDQRPNSHSLAWGYSRLWNRLVVRVPAPSQRKKHIRDRSLIHGVENIYIRKVNKAVVRGGGGALLRSIPLRNSAIVEKKTIYCTVQCT